MVHLNNQGTGDVAKDGGERTGHVFPSLSLEKSNFSQPCHHPRKKRARPAVADPQFVPPCQGIHTSRSWPTTLWCSALLCTRPKGCCSSASSSLIRGCGRWLFFPRRALISTSTLIPTRPIPTHCKNDCAVWAESVMNSPWCT